MPIEAVDPEILGLSPTVVTNGKIDPLAAHAGVNSMEWERAIPRCAIESGE